MADSNFDARAQAAFVMAVERGARIDDAAREVGVSLHTLYKTRRECANFAAAWDDAVEKSSAPVLIHPVNGRYLQKRRATRRRRFTAERKAIFLRHFAATCDATAAAAAAGVSESCVYEHRRTDPDFAAAWQAALEQGYARLEAEHLRQRLEAQQKMREALASGELTPELERDFERTLKLLDRYRRPGGTIAPRTYSRAHLKRWSFAEALAVLEKRLAAFGVPIEEDKEPRRDDDGLAA